MHLFMILSFPFSLPFPPLYPTSSHLFHISRTHAVVYTVSMLCFLMNSGLTWRYWSHTGEHQPENVLDKNTAQVVGMVREAWELGNESVGKLPEGHGR